MTVLRCLAIAAVALLSACAPPASGTTVPPSPRMHDRAAAPTTRLVLPVERPTRDLDCADFARRADAQGVLLADPRDPHGLDADRDGAACEHLR